MGSSDEPGSNAKDIDASVGGLVWVRRRNGSWWPGRILGLDEISEGSLVSPRSGTPVKLLGREDASVDWYNLEKSKRVKAFRCGEYNDCIEKARANAATGNKKAVKYARREDAILHALEIENDRLAKDQVNVSLSNNSGGNLGNSARKPPILSDSIKEEASDPGDLKEASESGALKEDSDSDSDSAPELSQSGLSFEEPNRVGTSKVQYIQGKRRKTPNDSEDDGTEGIKRMRGLEDLGMVVKDSNTGNCLSNGSPSNGIKGGNSSIKRKRTQVANVQELLKRKNRRRPLTKVLESTAVVSVPVICEQVTNSNGSPLCDGIESNESRKSVTVVANNNSDSNGVSCENGVSLNPSGNACDASLINCEIKKENDVAGVSVFAENESSDKLFNVPLVGEGKNSAGLPPVIPSPSTKHETFGLGTQSSQSIPTEDLSPKNNTHNECGSTTTAATQINHISQSMENDTSKWQLKGKRNSRHIGKNRKQEKNKYMSIDDNCDGIDPSEASGNWGKSLNNSELLHPAPQRSLPLRQSRFVINSRYQTSDFPSRTITESKLYEVKLDVKANYQPQNVPLVSLMSKLNGNAIVGRPLTVELLADGYCDSFVANECNDKLPYLLPIHNVEARKMPTKLTRPKRRFSKGKSGRKRMGLLSKKIRKLSSLTSNKERFEKPVVEKAKGAVVACIPLKVVFSRINEAVNGSARQTNRAITSNES